MFALLAQEVKNPAIVGISGFSGPEFFSKIAGVVISLLFVVGVVIFLFKLITGGFTWLTAGSDRAKLEGAKNSILHALLGLVILLCIFAIVKLVENFVGFRITYIDISQLGVDYK